MKTGALGIIAPILLALAAITAYNSLFVVRQTQQVLVVRLGEPVRVVTEAGHNFKAPFVDTVISIDKRILDLENPSQEIIASDQKRLVVGRHDRVIAGHQCRLCHDRRHRRGEMMGPPGRNSSTAAS